MLPQKRVGDVEKQVLGYLATHPDVMATQIVKDLEIDRSNLSKQLSKLNKAKFIESPFTQKSVKLQDRDVWRLTQLGIGSVMSNTDFSASDIHAMMRAYSKIHDFAAYYLMLSDALKKVGPEGERAMDVFYKHTAALLLGGVSPRRIAVMSSALLLDELGYKKLRRLNKILKWSNNDVKKLTAGTSLSFDEICRPPKS
jgi:hypothetical protein